MAINVKVPSDLSRVKEKVAFGLTKRQFVCFSLAALIGIPAFFLIKKLPVDVSVPTLAMMAVMMPLFFVAMYEKDGDTLELIIQRAIEFKLGKNQEKVLFDRMYNNGICLVDGDFYSKTIEFKDTNYKLASEEEKQLIFENWKKFLNYFDTSVEFEITFANVYANPDRYKNHLCIKLSGDDKDNLREEYSKMLIENLGSMENALVKKKYLTFGVHASSLKEARGRLKKIEEKVLENFEDMDVKAKTLNGNQRMELLNKLKFGQGTLERNIDYPTKSIFKKPGYYGQVTSFSYDAPEISDQFIEELLELDIEQVVSIHLQSVNQHEAIRGVKRTITNIDSNKIDEQKKAIKGGYDMDLIPNDLNLYGQDASSMLSNLQSQNERMFNMTFLLMATGKTKESLNNNVKQQKSIAQQFSCETYPLNYRQSKAIKSVLPLGANLIRKDRKLTTSAVAVFVPFLVPDLPKVDENDLYYGTNAITGELIFADRKKNNNPNGMLFGKPGSGKSLAAKREIVNVVLSSDDDIIINDPEREYAPLVNLFGGQVIHISQKSNQYINPMDINDNYSDGEDAVSLKAEFLLSLCELILNQRDGLTGIQKTIIDRCIRNVYAVYYQNPVPERMPLLEDLYKELMKQSEPEAKEVATSMELYVKGSLNVFNHRTNVNINNRIVCYDIKDLGKQLKKVGMLIVHDQVWGRVTMNRDIGKTTRYYMDEFHLLLKDEQTAAYSVEIYKRFRKWGGIPTALTQNVKDVLSSPEISNIFENCEFVYILNQGAEDKQILAESLGISDAQLKYVTNVPPGKGLMFCGSVVIPFKDNFPKDNLLYKYLTTRPEELVQMNMTGGT